jgi:DNA helicase II / ATP-dependent DNA helicase PcrA
MQVSIVYAYALLEGMLPDFAVPNPVDSARKWLSVICSRARKNLHLISETGRSKGWRGEYLPTEAPVNYALDYDILGRQCALPIAAKRTPAVLIGTV